jgi:hypothetical protein
VKGGGQRVSWEKVWEKNRWYIGAKSLLEDVILKNPTRMLETNICRYWAHWYKPAQSGQEFAFRTVVPYQESDSNGEEDQPEEEVLEPGETDGDQEGADAATCVQPPTKPSNNPLSNTSDEPASNKPSDDLAERPILNKCLSNGEKLDFLFTSIPNNNRPYHEAFNIVAAMSVSSCLVWFVYLQLITEVIKVDAGSATANYPAACFLRNLDTLYSNGTLHNKKSRKSNAFFEWLKSNPHLSSNGVLVNRSSLLQICLELAIALYDASIILAQDSEEDFPTGTPDFIVNSFWSNDQYLTI